MNSVIEGPDPIKGFVSELRVEIGDREAAAELAAQEMVKAAATYKAAGAQHDGLTGQMEAGAVKFEVVGSGFENGRFYTDVEMAEMERKHTADCDEAHNRGLAQGYAEGHYEGYTAGENNIFIALGRKALGLT